MSIEIKRVGERHEVSRFPLSTSIALAIWLLFLTVAFYFLYNALATDIDRENLPSVISSIAWPFATISLVFPVSLILLSHIRDVLKLRETIENAPAILQKSLDAAVKLEERIEFAGINADNFIQSTLGEFESRITHFEGRLRRIQGLAANDTDDVGESAREKLSRHVDDASEIFQDALLRWNSDGRRTESLLKVKQGGGNRPELVGILAGANMFDRADQERNRKVADYLKEAFSRLNSSRAGGVSDNNIADLDKLKLQAEEAGFSFR